MGGYVALMITDLIQGMIMIGGVAVMIFSPTGQVGGIRHATTELRKGICSGIADHRRDSGWLMLLSGHCDQSAPGTPQMVQKFYSIKVKLRSIGRRLPVQFWR